MMLVTYQWISSSTSSPPSQSPRRHASASLLSPSTPMPVGIMVGTAPLLRGHSRSTSASFLISGKCFCTLSPAPPFIVPAASLLTCIYHFVLLVFLHSLSQADIIHARFSTCGGKSSLHWAKRHFIYFIYPRMWEIPHIDHHDIIHFCGCQTYLL